MKKLTLVLSPKLGPTGQHKGVTRDLEESIRDLDKPSVILRKKD